MPRGRGRGGGGGWTRRKMSRAKVPPPSSSSDEGKEEGSEEEISLSDDDGSEESNGSFESEDSGQEQRPKPKQAIARPPEGTVVRMSAGTLYSSFKCAICLGLIDTAVALLGCLHRFCEPCIEQSLRIGNKVCPVCRVKCASRRHLRRDPNIDRLIALLVPKELASGPLAPNNPIPASLPTPTPTPTASSPQHFLASESNYSALDCSHLFSADPSSPPPLGGNEFGDDIFSELSRMTPSEAADFRGRFPRLFLSNSKGTSGEPLPPPQQLSFDRFVDSEREIQRREMEKREMEKSDGKANDGRAVGKGRGRGRGRGRGFGSGTSGSMRAATEDERMGSKYSYLISERDRERPPCIVDVAPTSAQSSSVRLICQFPPGQAEAGGDPARPFVFDTSVIQASTYLAAKETQMAKQRLEREKERTKKDLKEREKRAAMNCPDEAQRRRDKRKGKKTKSGKASSSHKKKKVEHHLSSSSPSDRKSVG